MRAHENHDRIRIGVYAAAALPIALLAGFLIERSYYTMDGKPRVLEDIVQNERLVVVLRVNEVDARRGRILLGDHLPAGFEIENPRLSDTGSGQRFSWLANTNTPEHSEYRKDRNYIWSSFSYNS